MTLADLQFLYEQNRIDITKQFRELRNKNYELYSRNSLEEAREFLKMYFDDIGINILECNCPIDNIAYLLVASVDIIRD